MNEIIKVLSNQISVENCNKIFGSVILLITFSFWGVAQNTMETFTIENNVGDRDYKNLKSIKAVCNVEVVNGKKSGECKCYYQKDSILAAEGYYFNDHKVGEWKYYFNTGQLAEYGSYEYGEKHRQWVKYYQNRWIEQNTDCMKDPNKHYEADGYSIENMIYSIEFFNHGKYEGISTYYDLRGVVTGVDLFEKGKHQKLFPK